MIVRVKESLPLLLAHLHLRPWVRHHHGIFFGNGTKTIECLARLILVNGRLVWSPGSGFPSLGSLTWLPHLAPSLGSLTWLPRLTKKNRHKDRKRQTEINRNRLIQTATESGKQIQTDGPANLGFLGSPVERAAPNA